MLRRDPKFATFRFITATAALTLSALSLASCDRSEPVANTADIPAAAPADANETAAPVVPLPLPPLTRGDLVNAAAAAASRFAQGEASPDSDPLVGRNFAVRIPFGCTGPTVVDASATEGSGLPGWSWSADRKAIQLRMTPSDWTDSALLAKAGAPDTWEAVEGFWLPRPWLTGETCPAVQADPLQTGTPPASPQTIGLAAAFEKGGSRLGRRNGRAYEHSIRGEGDAAPTPPADGFRLRLEGRIASYPSGRAIECSASGPDQRPICIVAIRLDRVAYEDAEGATLSEWRPG